MLGVVAAACKWRGNYIDNAELALHYWRTIYGNKIPLYKDNQTTTLRDPSADAIAAVSFYLWAERSPQLKQEWRQLADGMMQHILNSPYFIRNSSDGSAYFLSSSLRSTFQKGVMVDTSWGYFFLVMAIALKLKNISGLSHLFQKSLPSKN